MDAINASGQTAGSGASPESAVLVTGQTIKKLKAIDPTSTGFALAINDLGQVCGWSGSAPFIIHATFWEGNTTIDLGTLHGYSSSQCTGMDNFGREVGFSEKPDLGPSRGTVFTTFGIQNLNDLISSSLGVTITNAFGLSNTGYIAASCVFPGNLFHGCLLIPNTIFILKKEIYALEQGDPECIQCRTILVPEANSLPESLTDLEPRELARVVATVQTMGSPVERLRRAEQITAPQARLLLHDAVLTLRAAAPKTNGQGNQGALSELEDPATTQR